VFVFFPAEGCPNLEDHPIENLVKSP